MKTSRTVVTLSVAVLTALSLAVPAAAAPTPRTITWTPCAQDKTADCGTLVLPIDWSDPNGATFSLALARRKAQVPGERVGSLVVDPGGPGGSGIDFVLGGHWFSQQIQDRFDIVGFDPRGVGASQEIKCDLSAVEPAPTSDPATPAGYAEFVKYNRNLVDNCRQHNGPLVDHVDNLSVVRDIDAIRAALGEQKLNYWGVSYGTLMGQQYAETFPDHIRALALDSNMDHSQQTTGFMATEAATDEDAFHEFVKWCDGATSCVLHGQDVDALFNGLYAKAQQGTLTDPSQPGTKITPDELSGLPDGFLYGPSWPQLATQLKSLADGTPPAAARSARDDVQVPEYLPLAFCSDWRMDLPNAAAVAFQRRVSNLFAPVLRLSGLAWTVGTSCIGRTTPVQNPQHTYHVHGTPPIFMVNSLHDPATPYAWAVDAANQIKAATLVTYDGWGHGDYTKSPCVQDLTDQYLISLKVPAKGTHCAAVPPQTGPSSRALTAQTPSSTLF